MNKMNIQRCREEQSSPVPPTDQSEASITIACLRGTYLCTKQLQLISSHRTRGKAEEKLKAEEELKAESVSMAETGPRKPDKIIY